MFGSSLPFELSRKLYTYHPMGMMVRVPDLLPHVDRSEELLEWIEARARSRSVVPPYAAAGFIAVSVMPPPASTSQSSGTGSSSSALPSDLPPLADVV